jgi:hypothetical protein
MTDLNAEKEAAAAKYLDAWVDLANMPSPWERSVAQEAEAEAAKQRLEAATQASVDACLAAHPERQRWLDARELEAEQAIEDPEAEIG